LDVKSRNPQSPICDAIIDFGELNGPLPERHGVPPQAAGVGLFDVFDLSTCPTGSVDGADLIDTLAKDNVSVAEPNLQHAFLSPYPSPTQTLLDYPQKQWELPAYVKPLHKSISQEDLQYLYRKGALDIPHRETRDRLLKAYTKWIHPFSPMLDLEQVLNAIFSNGKEGQISLLLLQSMLFAATAHVAMDDPECDRKSARKIYYDRARLLHDLHVEEDRLSICQANILLSFWDCEQDETRDSYHWIGLASLHATSLGLHTAATDDALTSPRHQRTRKKTWWTLLVRDRLLALSLRRPVQNKAFRYDVPMLHLVDFHIDSFVETVQKTLKLIDLTIADMETMTSLWAALAQLSEYIDRVLNLQYAAQRTTATRGERAAVVSLVPKVNMSKESEIMACGEELQNWYGYLPTEVQQVQVETEIPAELNTIRVHRRLLGAYYAMTLMTLYRPLLSSPLTEAAESKTRQEAVKMVSQAATSITRIFTSLYTDNLISRLPGTAIAALEPAIATHLLNSTSEAPNVRDASFQKFFLCWRILLQFKKTYNLANTTMKMLEAAAKRLKSTPDLKALKGVAFSQLMNEYAALDEEVTKSYMAVPFTGVVGDQKTDRSDLTYNWAESTKSELRGSGSGVLQISEKSMSPAPEALADGLPVMDTFDQLLFWDEIADMEEL
jgi:hypothetical protein